MRFLFWIVGVTGLLFAPSSRAQITEYVKGERWPTRAVLYQLHASPDLEPSDILTMEAEILAHPTGFRHSYQGAVTWPDFPFAVSGRLQILPSGIVSSRLVSEAGGIFYGKTRWLSGQFGVHYLQESFNRNPSHRAIVPSMTIRTMNPILRVDTLTALHVPFSLSSGSPNRLHALLSLGYLAVNENRKSLSVGGFLDLFFNFSPDPNFIQFSWSPTLEREYVQLMFGPMAAFDHSLYGRLRIVVGQLLQINRNATGRSIAAWRFFRIPAISASYEIAL